MKPKDKERLAKNRVILVQSIEVNEIINHMSEAGVLTKKDIDKIRGNDGVKRQQTIRLLDLLEKKKTEVFNVFIESLSDHYPHIYMRFTDADEDFFKDDDQGTNAVDDEWNIVRLMRADLINDLNPEIIATKLKKEGILSEKEFDEVMTAKILKNKNEHLLDILEKKHGESTYSTFLEIVSDCDPHIYLQLANPFEDSDFDDDDF